MLEQANKGKSSEDSEQLIRFAVDGAKKMKTLMMDLLNYSRLTTPGLPFEAVDVQEVLDQSLLNLKSLIDEKRTEITYDRMPTGTGRLHAATTSLPKFDRQRSQVRAEQLTEGACVSTTKLERMDLLCGGQRNWN